MEKLLHGRNALVTGGSRGIGRAIALALAESGCNVAVNYIQAQEEALAVADAVRQTGTKAVAIRADVSKEVDCATMLKQIEGELGAVDILVNNAAINPRKPLAELTLEDWRVTMETNLTSSFLVSQSVLPPMRKQQWGRLIFLSSIAAQTGGVIGPHYAASKAGMLGLMHSYANLLAKEGITSNAIAPALIETDMIRGNSALRPDLIPLGRFGDVEEVARAAVFLATTGYVTGQTINLNGGWYMS